jgi:hypothetical protein
MQREGTLHILQINGAARNEAPTYHVGFADYQSGAAKKIRTVCGNDQLRSFLGLEIGLRIQTVASACEDLKSENCPYCIV